MTFSDNNFCNVLGLIDAITGSLCLCVQKKKESRAFKESALIQKDHPELRSKGRFTSGYNQLPQVRESRFKPLEEKIGDKRFASMGIFSLSRESIHGEQILVMDAAGNGVETLREPSDSDSDYYFITMLDSNQFSERKVKSVSGERRYDYGDAHLVDCHVELEDSNDKGFIFETRVVQVHWDNGRTSVLITNVPEEIFDPDNVVKSYFDRWPAQELDFRDMKGGVNLHRVVSYGKKLVDNTTVLGRLRYSRDR